MRPIRTVCCLAWWSFLWEVPGSVDPFWTPNSAQHWAVAATSVAEWWRKCGGIIISVGTGWTWTCVE
uniref:Putative secreted protein n=1 Tax=Anopheles darlingi TaxID=43151 RepID=A0A2M4DR90_ANODA